MMVAKRALRQFRTALRENQDLSWILIVYHKQDHQAFIDQSRPICMTYQQIGDNDIGPDLTYSLVCLWFRSFRRQRWT